MVAGTLTLIGLWAAAVSAAAPAVSGRPSPAMLAPLLEAARDHDLIVWSGSRHYRMAKVELDSTGVWSKDPVTYRVPRQAVIVSEDAPGPRPPPRPIPWSDVDSIATVKDPNGPVIVLAVLSLAGAVVGIFVAGIGLATHSSSTGNGAAIASMVVPAVVGIGLLSTSAAHSHVTVVYRAGQP